MLWCEIRISRTFFVHVWAGVVKYMLGAEPQLADLARRTLNNKTCL